MLHAIALVLYSVVCALLLAFGLVYLLRGRAMPYHVEAMGCAWGEVPARIQSVVMVLLRVAGASYLSLAVVMGWLLALGVARGLAWANWALLTAGLVLLVPLNAVVVGLRLRTGAKTPVAGTAGGLVMLLLAFGCQWLGG